MSTQHRNFILTILSSIIVACIATAAKAIIDVAKIEEKVIYQKETLCEIKDDVKEIKQYIFSIKR